MIWDFSFRGTFRPRVIIDTMSSVEFAINDSYLISIIIILVLTFPYVKVECLNFLAVIHLCTLQVHTIHWVHAKLLDVLPWCRENLINKLISQTREVFSFTRLGIVNLFWNFISVRTFNGGIPSPHLKFDRIVLLQLTKLDALIYLDVWDKTCLVELYLAYMVVIRKLCHHIDTRAFSIEKSFQLQNQVDKLNPKDYVGNYSTHSCCGRVSSF